MSLRVKKILLAILCILFVAGLAIPSILYALDKISFSAEYYDESGLNVRYTMSVNKQSAEADGKDTISGTLGYFWNKEEINPCSGKVIPESEGASPDNLRPYCEWCNGGVKPRFQFEAAFFELYLVKPGLVYKYGNGQPMFYKPDKFMPNVIKTILVYPNNVYSCETGKVGFSVTSSQIGSFDLVAGKITYDSNLQKDSISTYLVTSVKFTTPTTPTPTPPKKTPIPSPTVTVIPFKLQTINNQDATEVLKTTVDAKETTFAGTAPAKAHFRLVLYSDETVLGEATSDTKGKWSLVVPVDKMISGEHTLAYQLAATNGSFGESNELGKIKIAALTVNQNTSGSPATCRTRQITSYLLYIYILTMLLIAVGIVLLGLNIRKIRHAVPVTGM